RRLAEPGRAGEQDVVGSAVLQRRGVEEQLQLTAHLRLADELRARTRTQAALAGELRLRPRGRATEGRGAHERTCWGPSRASASRRSAGTGSAPSSVAASTTSSTACVATFSFQPRPTRAVTTLRVVSDAAGDDAATGAPAGGRILPASETA